MPSDDILSFFELFSFRKKCFEQKKAGENLVGVMVSGAGAGAGRAP